MPFKYRLNRTEIAFLPVSGTPMLCLVVPCRVVPSGAEVVSALCRWPVTSLTTGIDQRLFMQQPPHLPARTLMM